MSEAPASGPAPSSRPAGPLSGAGAGGATRRAPMLARSVNAWGDLSGSIRAELAADPSEAKIFAWLMIALGLEGLAKLPMELAGPLAPGAERMPGIGFALSLTVAPLFWYLLAWIAGAMVRSLGGTGSYRDHRAIWFWQGLVMLPVSAATTLLELPLRTAGFGWAPGALSLVSAFLSLLVFWRFYRATEDWGRMLADRRRMIAAAIYLLAIALLVGWAAASKMGAMGAAVGG